MVGNARRKAEVDEFDVLVLIQQNVFQLDVSVGDALAVAVTQCHQNLFENPPGLFFLELLVDHFFEVRMQTSPTHVLHDQVHVRVSFKSLDELDYVVVVHLLKQHHFAPHRPLSVDVVQL